MFQIFCCAPSRPERAAGSVSRCPSRPSPGAQRPVLGDFVTRTAGGPARHRRCLEAPGARHESTKTVAEKGHFVTAEHPDQRHFRFFYDRHERGAAGGGRRQAPPSASLQGRAVSPYRPSVKDGHSRRRAPPIPARHFCALRRLLRRSRPSSTLRRVASKIDTKN